MDFITDIISNLDEPANIAFIIITGCLIWLVMREIKCWYWKINNIITEQQKQTAMLYEMLSGILNEIQLLNNNQTGQMQIHKSGQAYVQEMQDTESKTTEHE